MITFELIIKYFSGKANPEEAMQVEDFVQASPENQAYFSKLHQSWLTSGEAVYQNPDIEKEWQELQSKLSGSKVRKLSWKIPAIAAALFILLGLTVYRLKFKPGLTQTTAKQVMELVLSDQSQVKLLSGAQLRYPQNFDQKERIVWLKGDGDFKVAHNPNQPFIVRLPDSLNIRVTGTEFLVRKSKERIMVDLKKGSVLFYNATDTLTLAAGQIGSFSLNPKKFDLTLDSLFMGSFQFNNQDLGEVSNVLEQYYSVRFHFQNPEIQRLRLSGGMNNKSLKQMVGIIAATFNLKYKIEGKNIYLEQTP